MAEPNQIIFSHKEVATALLKANNIHDGVWGVSVRFGLQATNLGATENDLHPCAVVPVLSIGLQRFEKVNNLSVDAAEVNPPARRPRKTKGAGMR